MLPLVEPGPPLTPEQTVRYSRHLMLPEIGDIGQRRLKNARVLAIGAGGLGSPSLLYLAAAGVGTLGVIDDDLVDRSNLHRQVLHTDAGVGTPKASSAARALTDLNPDVTVVEHRHRLTEDNIDEIFSQYDLVMDGTDNFQTRYLVEAACTRLGIPEVWGSILQFNGQVSVFWTGERAVAAGAPGPDGISLRDLFPTPPPPGDVPSCGDVGVLGALPGQIGTIMATEAVKLICGIGEPLVGRVMVVDTLKAEIYTVPFGPRPLPRPEPLTAAQLLPYCSAPKVAEVDIVEFARLREQGVRVLDVREDSERRAAHLPGSEHIILSEILERPELAAGEQPVYVHCKAGARSARAVEAMGRVGIQAINVAGGLDAWQAAGYDVEVLA
ncbi:adenylyltransferase/sulfurtransferase MoeZ [Flaviflexus salsibiostraticola]|uniref:Adenylyltransferase/sulfurtransferase MoeZ n=1 Tax=Flaviflexus salsibiostraticola TaxID=1282737 RepID=A0A3S8Z9T4_9ACTO|nr:ThiF family adenylyltransferase [Flaviflexus salsibiostraticola]AZN30155.1 adenylyltransferase/sulfurtransferase MoeZ [Flaviflexus salsibiostraticola]